MRVPVSIADLLHHTPVFEINASCSIASIMNPDNKIFRSPCETGIEARHARTAREAIEVTPLMEAIGSKLYEDGINSQRLRLLFVRTAIDLCRLSSPLSRDIRRNKPCMLKYLSDNWDVIDPIYHNILAQIPADIRKACHARKVHKAIEVTPLMEAVDSKLYEDGINSQRLRILFAQIAAGLCELSNPVSGNMRQDKSLTLKYLSDNWRVIDPIYHNILEQIPAAIRRTRVVQTASVPQCHLETGVETHHARKAIEVTPLMETIDSKLCKNGINSQHLFTDRNELMRAAKFRERRHASK
jgi:hypothetical protein